MFFAAFIVYVQMLCNKLNAATNKCLQHLFYFMADVWKRCNKINVCCSCFKHAHVKANIHI